LQIPQVNASPDGDAVAEFRIDGPMAIQAPANLTETIQIDDDVAGDVVGGVRFTLVIPEICVDNPADTDPGDGTMRGITVSFPNPSFTFTSFNVTRVGNDHQITVVAAAIDNLDSTAGLNVAQIVCTTTTAGGQNGIRTVTQTFTLTEASKFSPVGSLTVTGESKEKTVFEQDAKGGLDGNPGTDVLDVGLLADHLAGRIMLTEQQLFKADIHPPGGDGDICGSDGVNLNDLLAMVDVALSRTTIEAQCFS
jgi:hypothetical protein